MRWSILPLLILLSSLAVAPPVADAAWDAEWMGGTAWNAATTLTIRQQGSPDLIFGADFATRPFEQPLYWAARLSHRRGERNWSLELLHHKLILENGPPEIAAFSLTHGTNIVSLQHAWQRSGWHILALAGVVIAHPENTVRGRRLEESGGLFGAGYHFAGPAIGVGAGTRWRLNGWLDLTAETRVIAAWLEVDVVGGSATHTNLGVHLLVGPRLRF